MRRGRGLALTTVAIVASAAVIAAAVSWRARDDGSAKVTTLAPLQTSGVLFSTEAGDPIDVQVIRDSNTIASQCTAVRGSYYHSTSSCSAPGDVMQQGRYEVVLPLDSTMSPVVFGAFPAGRQHAIIRVDGETVGYGVRGNWFISKLKPGSLANNEQRSVSNGSSGPVTVTFTQ